MKRKKKGMSTVTRVLLCSWCVLMLVLTFFIIKWAVNLSGDKEHVDAVGTEHVSRAEGGDSETTPQGHPEQGNSEGDEKTPTATPAPEIEFTANYVHMGETAEEIADEGGVPYGLRYPRYEDVAASDAVELAAREVLADAVTKIKSTYGRKPKLIIDYEDGETNGLLSVLFHIETELDGKKETTTRGWVYNKKKSEVTDADSLFTTPAYRYIAEQVNALQTTEGAGTADANGFAGTREEFPDYLLTADGAKFYYTKDGERKEILVPYLEVYSYMEVTINGTVWADNIRDLDPDKPMIALTFDDGPNHLQTPRLLEILEKYGVKSTFFVLGDRVTWGASNEETLRMVYEAGHEVGSHTYTHAHLINLSDEEILKETTDTRDVIYSVIGEYPVLLRPPYGQYDDNVKANTYAPLIHWTIDSLDWNYKDTDKVVEHVLKEAKDGTIVLMHDIYWFTVDAVEQIVPELQARGYQIVTVRELLHYKGVELENGTVYHSNYN